MSKDGDDVPMTREKTAVVDIAGVEEYVDVVGSSTPVRANDGVEYEGFTFREAVSHVFVQDLSGVVDTSGLPLYKFLTHFNTVLVFLVSTHILATILLFIS